jgi:hypothetical protein
MIALLEIKNHQDHKPVVLNFFVWELACYPVLSQYHDYGGWEGHHVIASHAAMKLATQSLNSAAF